MNMKGEEERKSTVLASSRKRTDIVYHLNKTKVISADLLEFDVDFDLNFYDFF